MAITVKPFGKTAQGEAVEIIRLANKRGESVSVISFGAHLQSIQVLDKDGKLGEVITGLESVAQYAANDNGYMGGTIGRYGNRIAGASFNIGDKTYQLYANDGPNTLHGGKLGFDKRVWAYDIQGDSLLMRYTSPHMEEGFPGELKVKVRFSFSDDGVLRIDYEAVSDRDTQVNLTNHAYFNLGYGADIKGHRLQIHADHVIEADEALIPTGGFFPVDGSVYDLRQPQLIGDMLKRADNDMFVSAKGYDIGFVCHGEGMREIAVLHAPDSGRSLRVSTDLPGVQCYTGQYMDCRRNDQQHYGAYAGVCLETQYHPDTIHHPQFGDSLLKAGQLYQSSSLYAFSAK